MLVPPLLLGAPEADSLQHTRARMLSSVKTIQPGSTFLVGILLTMDPGWHTYWKNPGEAGLPTEIRWTLPKGFTAGGIQWPVPEKHLEAGDVLTYGYSTETMLLVPITAGTSMSAPVDVTIAADLSWLECENLCVPGSAFISLKLPVSLAPAPPDNEQLFSKYRPLLPVPFERQSDLAAQVALQKGSIVITLAPKGRDRFALSQESHPDFYPEPLDNLSTGRIQWNGTPETGTLTFTVSVFQPMTGARTLRGLIVYTGERTGRCALHYDIPLPAEYVAGIPGPETQQRDGSVLDRQFTTAQTETSRKPLLLYLGLAIIGGLLLNIMPCVLPVIALKIFGLVKMAGDEAARVKRLGWSFSLGILASFLVLALLVVALQMAGQRVGWGFQFQEPLFVIAMSGVVFAFGLSLFGVFEIQLPGSAAAGVSDLIAKQGSKGNGYAASFSEGVFATILATPCTAPFLGTALGFAFSQPAWVILLIFTCVALGMALPYLVLTARPAWLKFLPKPGEWMVTAKQFMGFLMMATLLWLLYILGRQLGMEAVIWTGAFLLAIGIACWLIGRFATLTASRGRVIGTWVVAALIVVLGYWLFLESILNVRSVIAGQPTSSQQADPGEGIAWEKFSLEQLDAYLQAGKPVFIDFTAEWCLTCKVNEKTVLADSRVVDRLKGSGMIPVKADWTNRNPDITRLLAKFGRSGVPLYVVFPSGRPNDPIVLPEVVTAGMVLDAIEQGTGR